MKNIILILLIVFSQSIFARGHSGGHVSVSGYTKRDGTYVQPHMRTAPDSVKTNNWSHAGNVNPYTGKVGTNTDSSPNHGRSGYYGNTGGYGYSAGYVQPQVQHLQQITRTLNPLDNMPTTKLIPD